MSHSGEMLNLYELKIHLLCRQKRRKQSCYAEKSKSRISRQSARLSSLRPGQGRSVRLLKSISTSTAGLKNPAILRKKTARTFSVRAVRLLPALRLQE